MFKRKFNSESIDLLVGSNSSIKGSIESEGSIKIEGKVEGDIKAGGNIFVGDQAYVKGDLTAVSVNLSGTVDGNIVSTGILHILSTAKLTGDVQVHSFVADEGGYFNGKCVMVDTEPNAETSDEKISPQLSESEAIDEDYEK